MNKYGATDPAEFFAVAGETFFENRAGCSSVRNAPWISRGTQR